uniref:Uncharacterized protein n=1 Tax=Cucumis melo TaxID=3656 RepID=A0A9I9E239_CUCME
MTKEKEQKGFNCKEKERKRLDCKEKELAVRVSLQRRREDLHLTPPFVPLP